MVKSEYPVRESLIEAIRQNRRQPKVKAVIHEVVFTAEEVFKALIAAGHDIPNQAKIDFQSDNELVSITWKVEN